MTSELKPCPFCGGAELSSGGDDKFVGYFCGTCQAAGPNHYGSHDWNTRAISAEPAQGKQSDIDWLNAKKNFEISHDWPEGGDESDEPVWKVHSVNGGRSDREWTLIAEDSDLSTAISKARKALAAPTSEEKT